MKNILKSSREEIVTRTEKQPYIESIIDINSGGTRDGNNDSWATTQANTQANSGKADHTTQPSGPNYKPKFKLIGHQSSVNRIHWAKRQENRDFLLSSSNDTKMIIWNVSKKRRPTTFKSNSYSLISNSLTCIYGMHSKPIRNAIWSTDETQVISVSYDQSCALVSVDTGRLLNRFKYQTTPNNHLTAVATCPNDPNCVLLGGFNEVLLWDTRTKDNRVASKVYKSQMGQVQDILFLDSDSGGGGRFATSGDTTSKDSANYSVQVWDLASTACLSQQIFHEKFVCTQLRRHPTRAKFYAQCHGNYVAEFDDFNNITNTQVNAAIKMNRNVKFESAGHKTAGYSIGFDLDSSGRRMVTGSIKGTAYVYDLFSSRVVSKIRAFSQSVAYEPCMDAMFQPQTQSGSGQLLAVSSLLGQIKVYEQS